MPGSLTSVVAVFEVALVAETEVVVDSGAGVVGAPSVVAVGSSVLQAATQVQEQPATS